MSDEDVKVEFIYEYWDCSQCGRRKLRGDVLTCPDCGTPRNESVRFYRNDEQEETVDDSVQKERFESGPDWRCSFCSTLNPDPNDSCRGCGHTRDESDKNYFDMVEADHAKNDLKSPLQKGQFSRTFQLVAMVALLVSTLALGTWLWAARTHSVAYHVTRVHWERTIPHLRYQWVEHEDWATEIQGESVTRISERRDIHHYEKRRVATRTEFYNDTERVPNGHRRECSTSYNSKGNGAAQKTTSCREVPQYSTRTVRRSREIPVYRDFPVTAQKVRYKSKTYAPLKFEKLAGDDNKPRWPNLTLTKGLDEKPDKEGTRSESYLVELEKTDVSESGPPRLVAIPPSDIFEQHFALGEKISVPISNTGSITSPLKNVEFKEPTKP